LRDRSNHWFALARCYSAPPHRAVTSLARRSSWDHLSRSEARDKFLKAHDWKAIAAPGLSHYVLPCFRAMAGIEFEMVVAWHGDGLLEASPSNGRTSE